MFASALFCNIVLGQRMYDKGYFSAPLAIPLVLSGTFGELRPNHLHTGLDIQTQGKEGLPVLAAASGYVSRIKVSAYGYGNALYIQHPNGYTTVYGHLKAFSPNIEEMVFKHQLEQKAFEVEMYVPQEAIKVKKGDTIAYSGNSGGSGGPHLHFEIRDQATEAPINPLFFGLEIKDHIKPIIKSIHIYPANVKSQVNRSNTPKTFEVKGNVGMGSLGNQTPEVAGPVYIAVNTYDMLDDGFSVNGVYAIWLTVNNREVYRLTLNEFTYPEARYANAVTDFALRLKTGMQLYRCYKTVGNLLSCIDSTQNNGLIAIAPGETAECVLHVRDFHQNESTVTFKLNGAMPNQQVSQKLPYYSSILSKKIYPQLAGSLNGLDAGVHIPAYGVYDTVMLKYVMIPTQQFAIPWIFQPADLNLPIHKYSTFWLNGSNIAKNLKDKTLAIAYEYGSKRNAIKGTWEKEKYIFQARAWASFTLAIDTQPPTVRPIVDFSKKKAFNADQLKWVIADNLAGLGSYNLYLNNEWVLAEFDGKRNLLYFSKKNRAYSGNYTLTLVVKDEVGNSTTYKTNITLL